jgi:hypothetical protein
MPSRKDPRNARSLKEKVSNSSTALKMKVKIKTLSLQAQKRKTRKKRVRENTRVREKKEEEIREKMDLKMPITIQTKKNSYKWKVTRLNELGGKRRRVSLETLYQIAFPFLSLSLSLFT